MPAFSGSAGDLRYAQAHGDTYRMYSTEASRCALIGLDQICRSCSPLLCVCWTRTWWQREEATDTTGP